jgi:hypothetical protein
VHFGVGLTAEFEKDISNGNTELNVGGEASASFLIGGEFKFQLINRRK